MSISKAILDITQSKRNNVKEEGIGGWVGAPWIKGKRGDKCGSRSRVAIN